MLGSHICERLPPKRHEGLGVDNFFTGLKSNVALLMQDKNCQLVRHGVTFPLVVEVDATYNLEPPGSPIRYQRDLVRTIKTNVLGAVNMLGPAKRLKVPFF